MYAGDRDTLNELWSRDACATYVGMDDREWFLGRDAIVAYSLAVTELENATLGPGAVRRAVSDVPDVEALQRGPVGWVRHMGSIQSADGTARVVRATSLWHLEHGQWRCVNTHVSLGTPNERIFGFSGADFDDLEAHIERIASSPSNASPSGGTVTIAFTDIEASTEMLERLGDERWMELLRWNDSLTSRATEANGGEVIKSQGDGYMLAFPSASGALDAVLSVLGQSKSGYLGQPVRIRAGVHAGDAVRERADVFGHAVVVAARVAAQALGGEVLATELVHGLVTGVPRFSFGPPRAVSLKGIQDPVTVRSARLAT